MKLSVGWRPLSKLAATLNRQLELAHTTRQSLLRDALAGRLVPQDLADENASLALKRIHAEKTRRQSEVRKARPGRQQQTERKSALMEQISPSPEALRAAWQKTGKQLDARSLFDAAGFVPEQVIQFYEALRATPELREAFQKTSRGKEQRQRSIEDAKEEQEQPRGRFRLVELWLKDFKKSERLYRLLQSLTRSRCCTRMEWHR